MFAFGAAAVPGTIDTAIKAMLDDCILPLEAVHKLVCVPVYMPASLCVCLSVFLSVCLSILFLARVPALLHDLLWLHAVHMQGRLTIVSSCAS